MTTDHPCANCDHPDTHSDIVGCLHQDCDCEQYERAQVARTIPARNADPATSKTATDLAPVKKNTQRAKLLAAFGATPARMLTGLTDEEAQEVADGVSPFSEYAKRCSELRDAGLIEPTGGTRKGGQGIPRIVSRITDAGRAVLAGLS